MELPYTEPGLSMVIVLPNNCDGLDDLQETLSTYNLMQLSNGMKKQKVITTIPKFKIETSLTLNEPLTEVLFFVFYIPAVAEC